MGAAAVAVAQDGARVSRRAALGPAEDRQARDGALAALVRGYGFAYWEKARWDVYDAVRASFFRVLGYLYI